MNALLQEYLPLVIFIGVSLVIGLALLVAPFIIAYRQPDPEKLSAYECGFNAFDDDVFAGRCIVEYAHGWRY